MIIAFRFLAILALIYSSWIIFRVVDDWLGIAAAILSVLLLPLTIIVVPILMFFIPTQAAGPLAIWPAIIFIGFLDWLAKKRNGSLLIR